LGPESPENFQPFPNGNSLTNNLEDMSSAFSNPKLNENSIKESSTLLKSDSDFDNPAPASLKPVKVSSLPSLKRLQPPTSNPKTFNTAKPFAVLSRTNDDFEFNKWMSEKEDLARTSLQFHSRFGLPEDFQLNPPLLDQLGGWNPLL
jgi:hypothetical protein